MPVKVFDRTPNLAGAQIISYRATEDQKWSVLIGITAGAPERWVASMQGLPWFDAGHRVVISDGHAGEPAAGGGGLIMWRDGMRGACQLAPPRPCWSGGERAW